MSMYRAKVTTSVMIYMQWVVWKRSRSTQVIKQGQENTGLTQNKHIGSSVAKGQVHSKVIGIKKKEINWKPHTNM